MQIRHQNILKSVLYAIAKSEQPLSPELIADYQEQAKQLPNELAILKLKPKPDNPLFPDYEEAMEKLEAREGDAERNKMFPPKGNNPEERLENISAPSRQTPNITEIAPEVLSSDDPQQKAKQYAPEFYLVLLDR
ncbi:hypothetical protein [Roseofilum casamattae]|uniref:Uncharacterized protein n=1 Tax=Roseofilum casamattae BLCC-M143 TaxID=3022442 RepID=A0ABT7BY41_9CYAN|nr:hypothetical protein [Roseofilum casamattae]MDJ1183727.1 hypothetical protein [Roseofilum casamattae BLCC-M143]